MGKPKPLPEADMGLFTTRRQAVEDVPAVEIVSPRSSVDGWTLAGTTLGARVGRDDQRELATLLHGVSIRVDTPYTYERASELLERIGENEQALSVCEAWHSHPASDRTANAPTSKLLTKRRTRLRQKVADARAGSSAPAG